jgi:hypothetical protein
MSIEPAGELAAFQHFIRQRLEAGGSLSPEEALDLWRIENPLPAEQAETVAALREALAQLDAGDLGTPLDEFDRAFRREHGLPLE